MSNFAGFDYSGARGSLPPGTDFEYMIGELIPGRAGLYLKVVPEPGTLVLLLSGGLGLLALVWRRRRR